MFEKEAEELIQKNIMLNKTLRETVYEAVEFGYKKGKEEIETLKKNNVEITDQWCKEQQKVYDLEQEIFNLKELHKANKWHKVADGDLPNDERDVLTDKQEIAYLANDGVWVDTRASVEIDDVIAWCEIPKFAEENEE